MIWGWRRSPGLLGQPQLVRARQRGRHVHRAVAPRQTRYRLFRLQPVVPAQPLAMAVAGRIWDSGWHPVCQPPRSMRWALLAV